MKKTFYWHDYETWGADPSRDRAAQFAGIRTDMDLNIIGEPLVIYCQPAADMLPHPEACLITGITPQLARDKGVCEREFIARIHAELAKPGTCGVGYNSLRFDDEITRFTLYRNFYDPYAREWQGGNSRWDIIDMVRLCHALRPEGIEWPRHDDGKPSFKLEDLTRANGIAHTAAHDALSDVHATIAMARLIREKQPRLYDYVLNNRNKHELAKQLSVAARKPLLHISSKFSSEHGCAALIMPLALHPANSNAVLVYDLSVDPQPLIELDADAIRTRIFTPRSELPETVERIALKAVHINRCPVIAPVKMLDQASAQRLQIDTAACRRHYEKLQQAPDLSAKIQQVFSASDLPPINDPDRMLYSGGFATDNDKRTMTAIRNATEQELREHSFIFEDDRYDELLFRYRGRNYPASLSSDEQARWEEFCYLRLTDEAMEAGITLELYQKKIEDMLAECDDEDKKTILLQLLEWGDQLLC